MAEEDEVATILVSTDNEVSGLQSALFSAVVADFGPCP